MKEFLSKLLKEFVSKPELVIVEESGNTLLINVDPSDAGAVIGKEGRNIRALRNLVNLLCQKKGLPRFELKVNPQT